MLVWSFFKILFNLRKIFYISFMRNAFMIMFYISKISNFLSRSDLSLYILSSFTLLSANNLISFSSSSTNSFSIFLLNVLCEIPSWFINLKILNFNFSHTYNFILLLYMKTLFTLIKILLAKIKQNSSSFNYKILNFYKLFFTVQ